MVPAATMARRHRLLLLLAASACHHRLAHAHPTPTTHASASTYNSTGLNFSAGAICAGVEGPDDAVVDMLRGKHLLVNELVWIPYAKRDDSHPSGWSGFNIDLLDKIAGILNFTYEIRDMGYTDDAHPSWNDVLRREIKQADLTMSFWATDPTRWTFARYLQPHTDTGVVLVGRLKTAAESKAESWTTSFYSFALPFRVELWVAICAMVVISGLVDFFVEGRNVKEVKLSSSLYEYCAGFLWGGFEYPLSRSSAIYQIICGFIVMIVISSYTANLAAFITISATPTMSVTTMDEAAISQKKICMSTNVNWNPKVKTMHPRIRYGFESTQDALLADMLKAGDGCDGLLTLKPSYSHYRAELDYCTLREAEVVSTDMGGWVTSPESTCVHAAVSYAISLIAASGELSAIQRRDFVEVPCSDSEHALPSSAPSSSSARARRLSVHGIGPGVDGGEVTAAQGMHAAAVAQRDIDESLERRRRLKTGGGGAGDAAADSSGDATDDVPQMGIFDFLGLFVIWGAMSLLMLCWAALPKEMAEDTEDEKSVSPDNEAGMLREVLRQLGEMQERVMVEPQLSKRHEADESSEQVSNGEIPKRRRRRTHQRDRSEEREMDMASHREPPQAHV